MKLAVLVIIFSIVSIAKSEVAVEVVLKPLPAEFQPLEPVIRSHLIAATQAWARHFQTRDCTIEVVFSIRDWPARGAGRSLVSAPFQSEMIDGKHVSEERAAQKIRTGNDPNGKAPDIEIYFDPVYFRTLWFDPEPRTRTAPMPDRSKHKLDAYSVILHELGHACGFNGFRDQKSGALPAEFISVYDRWVTFDGKDFFFNGPNARKVYGRPVPLAHTKNNYHHVAETGADPKLAEDLMNGITLNWSHRYDISPLDIAILTDCGLSPRK